jgi:hypothetical protein
MMEVRSVNRVSRLPVLASCWRAGCLSDGGRGRGFALAAALFAGSALLGAACAGLSGDVLVHGAGACTPTSRAAQRQIVALGGTAPTLERIGEAGSRECGYRLTSARPFQRAYTHYRRALLGAGWAVWPRSFRDPCALMPPPKGAVCGGGVLVDGRRGDLVFRVEAERGEAGRANLYVVTVAPRSAEQARRQG